MTQNDSLADMLYMYAASAYTLKKAFNTKVAMVTDSGFASILSDLPMPYDYVTTELDDLRADPRWWAAPKFHIFRKYSEQYPWMLQIDTDVFFWEPMMIGTHVDLLTQSIEHGKIFDDSYKAPVKFFQQKLEGLGLTPKDYFPWRPDLLTALNCGVVGFKDPLHALFYATQAMQLCDVMTPYLDEFDEKIPLKKRLGSAMVVPEQYFLQCYASAHNMQVAYVSTKFEHGIPRHYDPSDYYHAMADKQKPKVRRKFRDYVIQSQPELHRAIMRSAYGGL